MKSCEECGDEIPAKRLEALPGTTVCVRCQSESERQGKFQRHRMGADVSFKGDDVEQEFYLVRGTL